jgi:hypothetical protein
VIYFYSLMLDVEDGMHRLFPNADRTATSDEEMRSLCLCHLSTHDFPTSDKGRAKWTNLAADEGDDIQHGSSWSSMVGCMAFALPQLNLCDWNDSSTLI